MKISRNNSKLSPPPSMGEGGGGRRLGSAQEGLLPRREGLWLGEGWTKWVSFTLPLIPSRRGRGE